MTAVPIITPVEKIGDLLLKIEVKSRLHIYHHCTEDRAYMDCAKNMLTSPTNKVNRSSTMNRLREVNT